MAARLVTIGDSITQGFQHLAIRRPEWSYAAMVARVLGGSFRQADFAGPGGRGGPLVDLELVLRRLAQRCGRRFDVWDVPLALASLASFLDEVEDYWERGDGARASPGVELHHDLSVWGLEVLDALTLTDGACLRALPPPRDDLLAVPELGQYRTLRRVYNPTQALALEERTALELAGEVAAREGGVENLIVALGANNVLGACVQLDLRWSQSADLRKLPHERSVTVWEEAHFARVYADLAARVAAIGAQRVFLANVPHVTIAPITRGVSPRARASGGAIPPLYRPPGATRGYYEYYTHFWVWDDDFDPRRHPHLTREQAIALDRTVDAYNAIIQREADARGFRVIDFCAALDGLSFRGTEGAPTYPLPTGLGHAMAANPATAHRALSDGTLLLDARYLSIPSAPLPASTPPDELRRAYRGGLFGLDGAHPTTIGYGLVAHLVLDAMKAAGVPGAEPGALPWDAIVAADTLVTDTPPLLESLRDTLAALFGKLLLERAILKAAGYGAEP